MDWEHMDVILTVIRFPEAERIINNGSISAHAPRPPIWRVPAARR